MGHPSGEIIKLANRQLRERGIAKESAERYARFEQHFQAMAGFDEAGLRRSLLKIRGDGGLLPPMPRTWRGRFGQVLIRIQARWLWWLLRAFRLRDEVLEAGYESQRRQHLAHLAFQVETRNSIRELESRLAAMERKISGSTGQR